MSFYREHVYPGLVDLLGNPGPIAEIRRRVVPLATGDVLEIGAGSGVNFAHYDTSRVNKVYALEPNRGMLRRAEEQRRRVQVEIEFLDLPGERIPLADESVDTVVSTLTFCTIPGVVEAIRGIRRVLRPGGRLIFFEHGLSPDAEVERWQRRLDRVWGCAFGGCHLTRDMPLLIEQGGLRIEKMEQGYIAPFPKTPSYCWWGEAVLQAT
ncbi:methyltransferase [Edaphobacter acidisoli]|uniref:Methyltransferase n=1 Tax=Edaphobacter acidisoli TaxID=2040573 RepID=A0A916RZN3_9BACT|nr:class I SAM-dependent methyltransferase [Edaphobacter acidisoli]GGA77916.1 methyltransferase [Edaphobacter acidisoli]